MFSSRISLKALARICRSVGTTLHAGVAIAKAFELAAGKSGDLKCRRSLIEIADEIRRGNDVATAMRAQAGYWPDLTIDMVVVAEHSGALPEVLLQLADHYDSNLQLRRTFLAGLAWPVLQLVAAIFVIAGLIVILGMIAETTGGNSLNFLVFGLSGVNGAILWLTCTFGSFLFLFIGYQILQRAFRGNRILDPFLLRVPVLGTCMRSFAIARFSWAFYLTQQTGMPIQDSLQASLKATTNGAFIRASGPMYHRIESGADLSTAMRSTRLFPEDFLHMVDVAETSGTVPETLHRLGPQFEDQARRSLKALTMALGWLVWLLVAGFIVFFIFRFIFWYVGLINDATQGIF